MRQLVITGTDSFQAIVNKYTLFHPLVQAQPPDALIVEEGFPTFFPARLLYSQVIRMVIHISMIPPPV
jgi:hypothetical protein